MPVGGGDVGDPVAWSQAVITCRAAVSVVREPRRALPSTAITRPVVQATAVPRPASHAPIADGHRGVGTLMIF